MINVHERENVPFSRLLRAAVIKVKTLMTTGGMESWDGRRCWAWFGTVPMEVCCVVTVPPTLMAAGRAAATDMGWRVRAKEEGDQNGKENMNGRNGGA